MTVYTPENFESTEFILKHNVLLNRNTVAPRDLRDLKTGNFIRYRALGRPIKNGIHLNTCHQWIVKNTEHETRRLDCLHSTEFVDPDPIPELFPQKTLWYMATIFDPDAAPVYTGITDMLPALYRSKFGPGTPQAFLYETPIIGWVMYYQLEHTMWIVEVQGNNVLRGGILGVATGRRHFYRALLRQFLLWTPKIDDYIVMTYDAQEKLHNILRPDGPLPPSTPYRNEVMEWCGFEKKRLGDINTEYKRHSPIDLITDDAEVWYCAPGAWRSI